MKRLAMTLLAAAALAVPSGAAAQVVDPGGGGGGYCAYGLMTEPGEYSGSIPYSANSFTQLTTTIRNLNSLGFSGSIDVWTYSSTNAHKDLYLTPSWWPWGGQSASVTGPTYTTGWTNPAVPFHIYLHAFSDQMVLAYQVCA